MYCMTIRYLLCQWRLNQKNPPSTCLPPGQNRICSTSIFISSINYHISLSNYFKKWLKVKKALLKYLTTFLAEIDLSGVVLFSKLNYITYTQNAIVLIFIVCIHAFGRNRCFLVVRVLWVHADFFKAKTSIRKSRARYMYASVGDHEQQYLMEYLTSHFNTQQFLITGLQKAVGYMI